MGPRIKGQLGPATPIDTTSVNDSPPPKKEEKSSVKQQAPAKPASAETKTAKKSEHSMSGKMMAVKLNGESSVGSVVGMLNKATEVASSAIGKAVTDAAEATKPLSNGSKGPAVEAAQKEINKWRAENGRKPIKEDGNFTAEMETAVRDFQKSNGLNPDCIIGPNTRDRLALENDTGFKKLNEETKKQTRDQMLSYSKDQVARSNLHNLATDASFGRLSRDGQDRALKALNASPGSTGNLKNVKENVKDRATLEGDLNFKKLPETSQKRILDTMEKYAFEPKSREHLMKLATEPGLGKLPQAQSGEALDALAKNPADADYAANLRKVVADEKFQKIDPRMQTRTFDLMVSHATNGRYTDKLAEMATHKNFTGMDVGNQEKTLNLFNTTSPDARSALVDVMKRDVKGTSALLNKTIDGKGTLLDQLDRLNSSSLSPNIVDAKGNPQAKEPVVEELLKEIANPQRHINQSNRGTCSCTSMSYNLALTNPAEYGRIVTDLATTGKSKLAGGVTVQPPADAFPADNSRRSVGERLVQSALTNYGQDGNYKNTGGRPDTGGLRFEQEVKVLTALHGKPYRKLEANGIVGLGATQLALEKGTGPVFVGLKWDGGGHAVEVTKIENGKVYFRNPWGAHIPGITNGVGPDYTRYDNPPRRTEDSANGIQSMSVDDYQKYMTEVIVER